MQIQKHYNGAANCSIIGYNYILFEEKAKPLTGTQHWSECLFFSERDEPQNWLHLTVLLHVALTITGKGVLYISSFPERKMLVSRNPCEELAWTFSEENINGFA